MEILKDVVGYETLYKVSNTGKVIALDRYNTDKHGKVKFYPGKELKQDHTITKNTVYKRVTLSKNGVTKRYQVHQLVAIAFIPNPENKPYVNHIDNNGSNNNLSNLEWVTHSENMLHSTKQGRQFANQSKAGKVAGKKLQEKAIDTIKKDIGNTYGLFTILSYSGIKQKHQVRCICARCNSTFVIDYQRMKNKVFKGCLKCRNVKDTNLEAWKNNLKI